MRVFACATWPRSVGLEVFLSALKFCEGAPEQKLKGQQKRFRRNFNLFTLNVNTPRLASHCEGAPEQKLKGNSLHLITVFGGVRDQNDSFALLWRNAVGEAV